MRHRSFDGHGLVAFCWVTLTVAACAKPHIAGQSTTKVRNSTLSDSNRLVATCGPVAERAGREFGCFTVAVQPVGQLPPGPVFWHLDRYADRRAADAARGPRGTVVESFGRVWLLSIEPGGWRPSGGERVAEIGPLPVDVGPSYSAQYLEAVFRPGMKTPVHRHGGPEIWYTLSGETCLETPRGMVVGRAGAQAVIVPHGAPMELTGTGTETRRALVLILYDASQPATTFVSDWVPKGLCTVSPAP